MCTALSLLAANNDVVWGRTMDFAREINGEIHAIPANFEYDLLLSDHKITFSHSFLGAARIVSERYLFADGVNDSGLAGGTLYFPGYAHYEEEASSDPSVINLAATEFLGYCLGNFGTTEELAKGLEKIVLVGVHDSVTNSVAPLHWMFTDKTGRSIVVERMIDGFHVHENEIGVMANSPDFTWHKTNLRNYINVNPKQKKDTQWGSMTLTPFGQSSGLLGLPGDYTPTARFVRTAYQRAYVEQPADAAAALIAGFQILKNVTIPRGIVITVEDRADYTQYTTFINLQTGTYYFSTYDNPTIQSICLNDITFKNGKAVYVNKMNQEIVIGKLQQKNS